jgi:site-specific recombinase XerD
MQRRDDVVAFNLQAMLGHANLQTTAIYTHVAVAQLKKIHDATHRAGNNTC